MSKPYVKRDTAPRHGDSMPVLLERMAIDSAIEAGAYGIEEFEDTGVHAGRYGAIQAVGAANAVIASLVQANGTTLTTVTLASGDKVLGDFTSITLTSGAVLAYKRPGQP